MPNKGSACPICGQPAVPDRRPFCSSACRDRDLLQWLGEGYGVPGEPVDEAAEKSSENGVDRNSE